MSGQSSSGFKMSCGLPCLLFTPSMAKAGSFWKVSWHDYFSDSESYERKGIVIQDGFMKLYTFFLPSAPRKAFISMQWLVPAKGSRTIC
jgi:hypothetical protein